MPLLAIPEATHFCRNYTNASGTARGSFRVLCTTLTVGKTFNEGSPDFARVRDCSLREVERLLFLAVSHYRRSFNLLTPGTASWAHVTLYYGAFFAASGLLGMFGNWKLPKNSILNAARGTPGSQQLKVDRVTSNHRGSHKEFWEFFYNSTSSLLPWIDPALRYAVQSVSGNVTWLIDARNDTNYDSFAACNAMGAFQSSFRGSAIPASLPGALSTQFSITEGLVWLLVSFAKQFRLRTDALDGLQPVGPRSAKVRQLILDEPLPGLDRHVKRRALLG